MFPTIFTKLAVALVGLGIAFSLVLTFALRTSHQRFHLEVNQKLSRTLASQLLSEARSETGDAPDLDRVLSRVRRLAILNPDITAFTLSENGRILSTSRPGERLRRQTLPIEPILQFVHGDAPLPLAGEHPLSASGSAIFSAARIEPPPDGASYLYVVLEAPRGKRRAGFPFNDSHSLEEALWLALGNSAVSLVAAILVIRIVTNPVRRLRRIMEAFDRSGFTAPARYKVGRPRWTRDETDRLGEIFDAMADRITAQIESLRRADEARRELFANISHDLRTPLTAVRGYVDTLLTRQGLSQVDQRHYLGVIRRQTDQLSRLVAQVMELVKLDAPAMDLHFEEFSLDELVRELLTDLHPLLEQKRLEATVERQASAVRLSADSDLVRRALKNILDNAIRVSAAGGAIEIRIGSDSRQAEICIADRGPGVPVDGMAHVFRRFYRGPEAMEAAANGAGLGLAIARRIVELHGGSIAVENRPGGGARFCLSFPLPVSR